MPSEPPAGAHGARHRTGSEPLVLGAPPGSAEIVDGLARSGRCPAAIEVVTLLDDGSPPPGEAARVEAVWRRGRVDRSWVARAVETIPALRWVHSDFAGVDGYPLSELQRREILLTNGVGNFSRPMAEWVTLAVLAAAKRFPEVVRRSDAGRWSPAGTSEELQGKVALLLGLGSVNASAAELLSALGVEVRALVRRDRPGGCPGVSRLLVGDAWRDHLADTDYLVLGLPLTAETTGIVGREALGALKAGAWLVNVARGPLVDEEALLDALESGRLGGAVLDVFAEEPLPAGHPLWGRPNVVVVPHHTWSSPRAAANAEELFCHLVRAWTAGEEMSNVVDLTAGY
ncbi:MAG: D-2-hydroxyacid dehydrogenase [Acidimicrobiales bacterium]